MSAVLYLVLLLPLQNEVPADLENAQPVAGQDPDADPKADAANGDDTKADDAEGNEETNGDATAGDDAEGGDEDLEEGDTVDGGDPTLAEQLDEITKSGAIGYLREGGLFMWPILILGIIAGGVIIERFRSLRMLTADPGKVRAEVVSLLKEDRVEDALKLCEQEEGPVPAILSAGLRKYYVLRKLGHDPAKVEEQVVKAMDDYGVHVVAALEKHLPVLATISSVAPMLGFLGTVAGMVTSFKEIEAKIGLDNIVKLASGGISIALLTTAFGLIVGIPAFMGFNYFSGVINRFVLEVEESATELMETVTLQMALERAAD
jgi:biopolymer transport protein ExbB